MSLRSRMTTWWRAIFLADALDRQVSEELQFHIESYAEDLMRRGVTRDEALRRARAELGSVAAARENSRQAWGTRFFDEVRGDLRHALRMLAKSPGFTAIAVGSLALGIGANTVIFTAAQHMLLDRLDVPHPEQLRMLEWSEPHGGVVESLWGWWDDGPWGAKSTSFSYPVYQQLRLQNHELEDLFAFKPLDRQTVTVRGRAEAVPVEMVSGNYYSSLGVRPPLGRGIEAADDRVVGASPVMVISDRFWTKEFGRSPDVVGKSILVNLAPMTIVGVNPPGFTGAYSAQGDSDIFIPLAMQPVVAPQDFTEPGGHSLLENTNLWWVLVMGRVKPGVADRTAEASLSAALGAAVRATMPVKKDQQVPRLLLTDGSRGQNPFAEDMTKPIYVLMGLAGLVLLLACANLANLLLARAGARQREMSVRLALGAGRGRILRQMMTESLLLSLLGGGTGLLLAWCARNTIPRLLSATWAPPAFKAQLSWPVLAFSLALSLATGLIFGLAPAWEATRVQVSSGLKDSGLTLTRRRRGLGGKSIVVFQVALSVVLVVVAGLFVQSLTRLGRARLGFNPNNLMLFDIEPPQTQYRGPATLPLYQQLEQTLSAIPGAESVTLIRTPLISGNVSFRTVIPAGMQRKPDGNPSAEFNNAGAAFFSMFGIPILAGRGFTASDTETSRDVAVINESFAKKYYPGLNPIGRTFETGFHEPYTLQIVGVCGDAKYQSVGKDPEPVFFLPWRQEKHGIGAVTFVVKTRIGKDSILPALRQAVASVDRNLPMLDVRTQEEQIAASLRQQRIFANLTECFGILALILAAIGIYGIMAYSVSRRTNEIGIRMALGAQPRRVLRMVLGEASWMVAIGMAAGLAGALGLGRVIGSMLYGLKPWDTATFAGSSTLLILVALGASWIPARRAAGVDPMKALRHE